MKLILNSTLLLIAGLMVVACAKSEDGGGDGGNAQPTAQPNPTPVGRSYPNPYNNLSGPNLSSNKFQMIRERKFLIYNADGVMVQGCDEQDPRLLCVEVNGRVEKHPVKNYTMVASQNYLNCIAGRNVTPYNVGNMNIPNLCQQDAMRVYSSSQTSTSGAAQSCLLSNPDIENNKQTTMITQFDFDPHGRLSFTAKINQYYYQATNIGYQYNPSKRQLIISKFTARGNNPALQYLSVSSMSALQRPQVASAHNMLLKESNVRDLNDGGLINAQNGGFRFSEAVLLRLSNRDNSPLSFNQYASANRNGMQQPYGNMNQQMPNQYGNNQYGNNQGPNNNTMMGPPVDPRFSGGQQNNGNAGFKFMVIGGNMLLMPEEMLPMIDSVGRAQGGQPAYVPFSDPRG